MLAACAYRTLPGTGKGVVPLACEADSIGLSSTIEVRRDVATVCAESRCKH